MWYILSDTGTAVYPHKKEEDSFMWYVIQVTEGSTENAVSKCRNAFPETSYSKMFIPMYERKHKTGGEWFIVRKELFSGYFFVDSDNGAAIEECLKPLSRFVKPVCVGKDFVPIREDEQKMLESLFNSEKVIAVSRGDIVNGEYEIYEGPLIGKGTIIRRVNRHKRIGEVEISLHGEPRRVRIGLEIVNKTMKEEMSA